MLPRLLAGVGQQRGASSQQPRARRQRLAESGSFVGHRPYERGDDLRRIDWAAYARSGELHLKLHEADDRRAATLLLDLSASLCTGTPHRRMAAMRLAAVLGGALLRQLDAVWVVAPAAGAASVVSFAGIADLARLLQHLEHLPVAPFTPAAAMALLSQRGVPPAVHWISDFADLEGTQGLLHAVRTRGGGVTGWLPTLPADREAPPLGYQLLVDPETGAELRVAVDASLAAAVQQQLLLLARTQQRLFAQSGCRLWPWQVPQHAADELRAYREILQRCRQ
jgi:uncharacterized protein (DUF58 family)